MNKKQKTVREWFEELPDGSFKMFLINNMDVPKMVASSLSNAIFRGADMDAMHKENTFWLLRVAIEALEQMQPKQVHEFECNEEIWVSQNEKNWYNATYVGLTPDGKIIAVSVMDDLIWNYARPIKSTVTVQIEGEEYQLDPELAEEIKLKGVRS